MNKKIIKWIYKNAFDKEHMKKMVKRAKDCPYPQPKELLSARKYAIVSTLKDEGISDDAAWVLYVVNGVLRGNVFTEIWLDREYNLPKSAAQNMVDIIYKKKKCYLSEQTLEKIAYRYNAKSIPENDCIKFPKRAEGEFCPINLKSAKPPEDINTCVVCNKSVAPIIKSECFALRDCWDWLPENQDLVICGSDECASVIDWMSDDDREDAEGVSYRKPTQATLQKVPDELEGAYTVSRLLNYVAKKKAEELNAA